MATTYNLEIIKGSTFSARVTATNSDGSYIDLTSFNARGYIRYSYGSTGILLDMQPTVDTSYISGIVNLVIPSTGTATLPVGVFPQDIEIYSGDYVVKFLRGYASVLPESTY
jgi:hypothetical protein